MMGIDEWVLMGIDELGIDECHFYGSKQAIFKEDGGRLGKNEVMMPKLKLHIFLEESVFKNKEFLVTKNRCCHFIPSTHLWRRIEDILFCHSE